MTAPAHLTDEQVDRFRNRALAPAELLELDEHVSICNECRDRLYAENRVSDGIRSLRADLDEHLSYQQLVSCSEGMASAEQRLHLRDCAMCQGEVQDLSRFRTELAESPRRSNAPIVMPKREVRRWQIPVGIAAAVLLVAGGVWTATRPTKPASVAQIPAVTPAEAPLPPTERAMLDRAMASNSLDRAPVLDHLIVKPSKLLGSRPEEASFDLLTPVGTTVVSDQPLMRWTPVVGATGYVVSIFDERFAKVVESPTLTGTDWKPATALPRGKILIWQVTATARGRHMRAPRPPAAEARFEVVSQEVADHIAAVRRQHPGNALLRAVLLANAGALDDALEALQAMDTDVSQRYRESILRIRHPE
jgi:hypothetical protein